MAIDKVGQCGHRSARQTQLGQLYSSVFILHRWIAVNPAPPATRLMPLQLAPNDTTVLQAPKYLPDAVVQVPQRDADGNPVGGVRPPDMGAPLCVHGLQNEPLNFVSIGFHRGPA